MVYDFGRRSHLWNGTQVEDGFSPSWGKTKFRVAPESLCTSSFSWRLQLGGCYCLPFHAHTLEPPFLGSSSEGTAENWKVSEPAPGEKTKHSAGDNPDPWRLVQKVTARAWQPRIPRVGLSGSPT